MLVDRRASNRAVGLPSGGRDEPWSLLLWCGLDEIDGSGNVQPYRVRRVAPWSVRVPDTVDLHECRCLRVEARSAFLCIRSARYLTSTFPEVRIWKSFRITQERALEKIRHTESYEPRCSGHLHVLQAGNLYLVFRLSRVSHVSIQSCWSRFFFGKIDAL